jgi:sulfide:quinone oxidoreductase
MHVLIAGGGVAALEATLALRSLAEERVDVELLAPEAEFTYRPLAVAEPFRAGEPHRFPLEGLAREAGGELRRGTLASVDPARRSVVTGQGEELPYDVLLLALGARPRETVTGALTFRGPEDGPALGALLEDAVAGRVHSIAFVLPVGVAWPLPLYELALLTRAHLAMHGTTATRLTVVTPEDVPLALFGTAASDAVRALLDARGIELRTATASADSLRAERVVAMPRLEGPALPGLPQDEEGFVPTDEHGLVAGLDDVYAAGDLTTFPVKQGGIAAQQADAAAAAIAAKAGAAVTPEPFRPILRGLLMTGIFHRYLEADPADLLSTVSTEPLWWPPTKIAGRHLAPFLAPRLGLDTTRPPPPGKDAIPVEIALDPHRPGALS